MAELKITAANFENEVLRSDKPVLLDFYADWCGPCKMLAPVLHEIAEENADALKVGKINVDEQMELAMRFQVSSTRISASLRSASSSSFWEARRCSSISTFSCAAPAAASSIFFSISARSASQIW